MDVAKSWCWHAQFIRRYVQYLKLLGSSCSIATSVVHGTHLVRHFWLDLSNIMSICSIRKVALLHFGNALAADGLRFCFDDWPRSENKAGHPCRIPPKPRTNARLMVEASPSRWTTKRQVFHPAKSISISLPANPLSLPNVRIATVESILFRLL